MSSWDWLCEHGRTLEGMPFDGLAYPQLQGVCDAFDDPAIREIDLEWGTRLGKTFIGHGLMLKTAGTRPRPMLLVGPSGDALTDLTANTLVPMAERCGPLSTEIVGANKRSLRFRFCRIKFGWSGSASQLADFHAWFLHANEVSKWSTNSSAEADPLPLARERVKGSPDHKILLESTPTIAGHCRIDAAVALGNDCRRWVPCPRCHKYQTLDFDHIRWDHLPDGSSDHELARKTARYVCEHCQAEIHDDQRPRMMRNGVWAPLGCHVEAGQVKGTPKREGSIWSSRLSSLYSLQTTWGVIAQTFLRSKDKPRELQNFHNSWLAKVWQPRRAKSAPEEVGQRLKGKTPRGTVPTWGRYLAIAADHQGADGGFYVFVALAMGAQHEAGLVELGVVHTLDDLWTQVIRRGYPHADGGDQMLPAIAVIDSGFEPRPVYDFSAAHPGVWPCKGSSHDLNGQPYRFVTLGLGDSKKKRMASAAVAGQRLLHVATDYWESDLQQSLDERKIGDPHSLTLFDGCEHDAEFLEQLCNGMLCDKLDARNNAKLMWVKRWDSVPNDFRDALRYGLCAARFWFDSRKGHLPPRGAVKPAPKVFSPGATRPDGRPWI